MSRRLTLIDLTGGAMLALVAVSLLSMSVSRMRATARMNSCSANLKQIGLGFHNYHSAYNQLPFGSGGTSAGSESEPMLGNANRLCGLVGVTPFIEQQALWQDIANPRSENGEYFPAMGPVPWYPPSKYSPWSRRPDALVCPDDPAHDENKVASSYLLNYGDAIENVGAAWLDAEPPYGDNRATTRGLFIRQHQVRFRDVLDGLSNTLMMTEGKLTGTRTAKNVTGMIADPSRCLVAHQDAATDFWDDPRPAVWADGSLLSIGFQTILPPNSPSCTSDKGLLEGVMSASSHHDGGVHVLMSDGRVAFVSDTIDAGQADSPSVAIGDYPNGTPAPPGSPSPYGIWGALGTRAAREVVNLDVLQPPQQSFTESQLKEFESFPLETWRDVKGRGSIQARQIDVDNNLLVLLMSDGKVRRIPLEKVNREDAYRALRTKQERLDGMMATFMDDMQLALGYLEQKEFATFVDECVLFNESTADHTQPRQQLISELATYRGRLILALDQVIAMAPSQQSNWTAQVNANGLILNIRGTSAKFHAQRSAGRWKILLD